jgi:hypothetical protein
MLTALAVCDNQVDIRYELIGSARHRHHDDGSAHAGSTISAGKLGWISLI